MNIGSLILPPGAFLAPMAGVTDMPFRLLCHEQGSAFAYTEMVSAKGLHYAGMVRQVRRLLMRAPQEGAVGAQLFGHEPGYIYDAVKLVLDMGFKLIDLNMGCPAPKIVSNGEGCALMREPLTAAKVIEAAVCAARSFSKSATPPVTVKFRKGWDTDNYIEFSKMAESSGASALTIHGRTRSQFYSGKVDIEAIAATKAVVSIPVIGNGDITSEGDARSMLLATGCDAVMIGRGAMGNPWIFGEILGNRKPTESQKNETALRHAHMLAVIIGERQAVREMRKHMSWYLKGLRGSAALRQRIHAAETIDELSRLLDDIP